MTEMYRLITTIAFAEKNRQIWMGGNIIMFNKTDENIFSQG